MSLTFLPNTSGPVVLLDLGKRTLAQNPHFKRSPLLHTHTTYQCGVRCMWGTHTHTHTHQTIYLLRTHGPYSVLSVLGAPSLATGGGTIFICLSHTGISIHPLSLLDHNRRGTGRDSAAGNGEDTEPCRTSYLLRWARSIWWRCLHVKQSKFHARIGNRGYCRMGAVKREDEWCAKTDHLEGHYCL